MQSQIDGAPSVLRKALDCSGDSMIDTVRVEQLILSMGRVVSAGAVHSP